MRSWLTLLALTLAVGGLAAWLFMQPQQTPATADAISNLKSAQVTRLTLATKSGSTAAGALVIEKHDGVWRIVAPFKARADDFPIERLLSILEARPIAHYPATDLARYGLDTPLFVLTANDQSISYGAINPNTREQYVLSGNRIYVVPLDYAAALPRDVNALLSKALFAPDEKSPARFDLPDFTVALEEGTWAIAPIASEASADERNGWVDAWKGAAALTVARYARDAPSESVKVTLKDGRTIQLGIAEREPDVVLVREDEGVAYHFFAESGRKLLAPPGARPAPGKR